MGSSETGLLIVISAPSGAGKTTLAQSLVRAHSKIKISVSHTTRPPRPGDEDGKDYYFVDDESFDQMVRDGSFLEWAHVHDHRYGTSKAEVDRLLSEGAHLLFDVDYQGGISIMESYKDAISVFILPPSQEVLSNRLRRRATDTQDVIERRLKNALHEMKHFNRYRYVIINDDLSEAVTILNGIYTSQLHLLDRMRQEAGSIIGEFE
jgi:guanylate kinase